jgi:hypothetical protein
LTDELLAKIDQIIVEESKTLPSKAIMNIGEKKGKESWKIIRKLFGQ